MWLSRDEYQQWPWGRRDDVLHVFVRYVEAGPRRFVAESDAPVVRVEGRAICQARHRMEVALAQRMGSDALRLAVVVEDLPEGQGAEAEEAEEAEEA